MFIETHTSGSLTLAFLKSNNVQVYPCGRRRAEGVGDTFIPFDPEARLNTEANAIKHSSLNGFTQTYLKDWDEANKLLTISLAGYLFTITLEEGFSLANEFGSNLIGNSILNDTSATHIYANILLEDIKLFSGRPKDYFTSILRNQSASDTPVDSLDQATTVPTDSDYYFSGLSFSTEPLAGGYNLAELPYKITTTTRASGSNSIKQLQVSLCILERLATVDGDGNPTGTYTNWMVYEPARLPNIKHGNTVDSVILGYTTASSITTKTLTATDTIVDGMGEPINNLTVNRAGITTLDATTIKATNVGTEASKITNIHADKANIDTITATTLNVNEAVTSPQLGQVIGGTTYKVPYIKLGEGNQLQIFNIGTIPVTAPEE